MRIPTQIFTPLVEALLSTPFKLHAQVEPHVILSQLEGPVRAAQAFDDFAQPLVGLTQLIDQMADPAAEDPSVEMVSAGINTAIDRLAAPARSVDPALARSLEVAVRRWRSIIRLSSSNPVEAKQFSEVPPPIPKHLSIPPAGRPPNLAEWPTEDAQLTPEFLRGFIDSFSYGMGIWELSKEGRVQLLMINRTLKELSGYSESDLMTMSMNDLFHPDDHGIFREIRRDVAQEGYGMSEKVLRVIDADRNVRWVDMCIAFLENSPKGYVVLVEQTERYLAQEENATLREAYRNARRPTSVFILPRSGGLRVVLNNLALEKMLGYQPGEMKDKKLSDFFPKASRFRTLRWLLQGIRRKKLEGQDIDMLCKNGAIVPIDIEADISEVGDNMFAVVKFAESEHRVRADRMQALATLVPGLGHDFNNALAIIMGECELLLRGIDRGMTDDEKLVRGLQVMYKSAVHLRDHIRRLQGLASTKGREEDRSPAEIEELIDKDLVEAAVGHDVAIAFDLVDEPWQVPGPLDHLWEALNNILLNARDAMEFSSVKRLRLATRRVQFSQADLEALHVEAQYPDVQPGEFMSISVTDSGPGIPRAKLGQIFQPYQTTKKQPSSVVMQTGHSGLGLWMTHQIIAERGGFIRVASDEGEGATFELFLPRAKHAGHVSQPPSSPGAKPEVILAIGNAERSRAYRAIRYSLQSKSQEYKGVESLEEARQLLAGRHDIRAVIIDLPETDKPAADIIAEIRAVQSNLPVVVVSAADINVQEDDVTCRVDVPFTPMVLMQQLQRIVKDSK